MLFQVSLTAQNTSIAASPQVQLNPQIEAADEAGAREKLAEWLDKVGYRVADGAEPTFKALDPDTGLPPDVQAVNDLQDQLAEAQDKLKELTSSDVVAERDEFKQKKAILEKELAASTEALNKASESLKAAETRDAALSQELIVLAQKLADKDSELATLKAQLEEALVTQGGVKASEQVAPPAASPADGTTPSA